MTTKRTISTNPALAVGGANGVSTSARPDSRTRPELASGKQTHHEAAHSRIGRPYLRLKPTPQRNAWPPSAPLVPHEKHSARSHTWDRPSTHHPPPHPIHGELVASTSGLQDDMCQRQQLKLPDSEALLRKQLVKPPGQRRRARPTTRRRPRAGSGTHDVEPAAARRTSRARTPCPRPSDQTSSPRRMTPRPARRQAFSLGSLSRACARLPAMTELGPVAWPPAPIRTERLILREPEARDRAAFIGLLASPEVHTYLGSSRPRDELKRAVPEIPERRPGLFAIDLDGAMIGMVKLDRHDAESPGHVRPDVGEAELGYLFLPEAWGRGYAVEACTAVLNWFTDALPGTSVVLAHPDRQRALNAPRSEAGVHRGGAVRGLRRRAVVRRLVFVHAVRLS